MKKVLIIQNKRIGDVLIASVIANNFKAKFPDSEIHLMAYDFSEGVVMHNPNIDKFISVKEKELKKLPVLLKTILQVRREKYDIIFDPYSKTQSRLICKFSGAKMTIGARSRKKLGNWGYYTNPLDLREDTPHPAGKAIQDRIKLLREAADFPKPDYHPHIFLSESEKQEDWLGKYKDKKVVVLGVLGSTPQKSMPYEYVAAIADFIAEKYGAHILFNYAPYQKDEAMKIYNMCSHKENIIVDIYAPTIRDFIKLMYQCDVLVANEGGSVHIAKALDKPTFTIFSPYIKREHWASFEDGNLHTSVHLADHKPELLQNYSRKDRKEMEKNPQELYRQLTPEMIIPELDKFLSTNLK